MYEEEFDELKFNVNRGRDAFIEQVLNVIDVVSDSEKKGNIRFTRYLTFF